MSTSFFATHLPAAPKKEWSYTSTPAHIRFHVVHSDDFTLVFDAYFSTAYVLNILALASNLCNKYARDVSRNARRLTVIVARCKPKS
jgi:hypothetical protein